MRGEVDIAAIGALLADSARASMLTELLGGQPLTASELARRAGVSRSGASNHLKRLAAGGLVEADSRGRNRIYSLAGADTARALEALGRIAPEKPIRGLRGANARDALARARTCYDHLAGKLGVALTRSLESRRLLQQGSDNYTVTRLGEQWLTKELGIDIAELRQSRRAFAVRCMDLTERQPHLAGALGAAIATSILTLDFARRSSGNRALRVTDRGKAWLAEFGIRL